MVYRCHLIATIVHMVSGSYTFTVVYSIKENRPNVLYRAINRVHCTFNLLIRYNEAVRHKKD
jgi:hypothetical protein